MKQFRKKSYPSISEVTKTEHIGMVKEIFGTITELYDFLNHFLILRRDIAWRRFAVRGMRFLRPAAFSGPAAGGQIRVLFAGLILQDGPAAMVVQIRLLTCYLHRHGLSSHHDYSRHIR